jgi:hypothetical protein
MSLFSELSLETDQKYYSDKTCISQSMLSDFVQYDKWGNRTTTPEVYYAKHIAKNLKSPSSEAMLK